MNALEQIIEWMLNSDSNDAIEMVFELDEEIISRLRKRFPAISRAELLDIWHAGIKILADVVGEEVEL